MIVADLVGVPNLLVGLNTELQIVNHWSYQSVLFASFQLMFALVSSFPEESCNGSLVLIFVIFKSPLAGTFLFGL